MLTITKDTEAKLVDMVGSIRDESVHWTSIYFAFSKLLEHYKSEYQIKIAVNLINDLLKTNQGGIFVCNNSDIYVVCRNLSKAVMDKVIFQLRYLFMDDPLAYKDDGQENEAFCKIYDLGTYWQEFMDICKRKITSTVKEEVEAPGRAKQSAPAGKPQTFTPSRLATVERDLANADLSRVLRRQPVCAVVPGSTNVRKVFDELYINIAHLRQFLKVDVDLLSNRWLFKYLTQVLDNRMIDLLKYNPSRYFDTPISLNLNVATLLSNKFAELDALIKPAVKVSIVLEIQLADVFADMGAFMVAKDSVQKLGYRVCLDGLTNLSFTQVDRERLGFDLAKLQWNADIESDLKTRENKKLAEAIKVCGANRIILCRCDSRQAIDYGQAMGISLYQGRYLDMLVNPNSKIEN